MERSLVAAQLVVAFVGPGVPLVSNGSGGTHYRVLVRDTDTERWLTEVAENHTSLDHSLEAATAGAYDLAAHYRHDRKETGRQDGTLAAAALGR